MNRNKVQLIFTGDLCCHNHFARKLEGGSEIVSEPLKILLSKADYVVYNYEGSSFGQLPLYPDNTNLKNSCKIAPYLRTFSKPLFNLANNHTMDFGEEGMKQTISFFNEQHLPYFGVSNSFSDASKPFVIKKEDFKVNIWGINAYKNLESNGNEFGLSGIGSLKEIQQNIQNQQEYFRNILCIHGGEEFTFFPMPYKRKLLRNIAQTIKPDVIICHHSHTIQGFEKVGDTLIFYSLGNFMFDYPSHSIYNETQHGLLVNLTITKTDITFQLDAIEIGHKKAMVDLCEFRKLHDIEDRIALRNYKRNIAKDAHRVVFDSKKNRSKVLHINQNKAKSMFPLSKFKLLKDILSDKFLFSLYLQAVKQKIYPL